MRSTILAAKRARGFRRALTLPEGLLWRALRRGGAGARFRRQHPMGSYILDFYCPAARLAVEVDGEGHAHPGQIAYDRRRDAWLAEQGVRVLRVSAVAVLDDHGMTVVLARIAEACRPERRCGPCPLHRFAVPLPRSAGEEPCLTPLPFVRALQSAAERGSWADG